MSKKPPKFNKEDSAFFDCLTSRGAPDFTVTGEASHTLRWVTDVYACVQVVN